MGWRLFDFECNACKAVFEELVHTDTPETAKCKCGSSETTRLIGAPRIDPRLGLDPDFATMSDKWAKTRYQRAKIERKQADSHGES
jgi:putative FmdB family regulatory protein